MELNFVDIIIIISYFILVLVTGLFFSKRRKTDTGSGYEGYLLAGRKVTLPLFVATLVATWYGNILGVGEFVYKKGFVAWMCFMFPYYITAGLYAIFISKKIRLSNSRTIPEQFSNRYDDTASWLSAFFILIITIPAAYFLMLGFIIQMFSGWALWLCITLGAVFSLSYIYNGGLKADILTNAVQFVLMYIGFAVLLFFSIINYGPPDNLIEHLPDSHKSLFGESSWQYIIAWFIIALQTFIDPSFHQRASAAKSPEVAKKGVLISIVCWMVFDTLTLLTGFYARAFFDLSNPVMAYPVLGDAVLPHFWKGLFVVSLMATIMSTLDSYAFISAATIGNDLLSKFKKSQQVKFNSRSKAVILNQNAFSDISKENSTLIKLGLILTGIIGTLMALGIPSVIELIYKTASISVPALLVPLVISYSNKFYLSSNNTKLIMIVSGGISLIFTFYGIYLDKFGDLIGSRLMGIEPMMPGMIASFILGVILIKRVK